MRTFAIVASIALATATSIKKTTTTVASVAPTYAHGAVASDGSTIGSSACPVKCKSDGESVQVFHSTNHGTGVDDTSVHSPTNVLPHTCAHNKDTNTCECTCTPATTTTTTTAAPAQAGTGWTTETTSMHLTGFDGSKNLAGKNNVNFVHLEDDKYMIKDGANCLIYGGNGNNKYPQFYNWGGASDFCGFPDQGGGEKASLLANGQAIFSVNHLEGDKYTIKYAQNGKCLIYGASGKETEAQRYLWNTAADRAAWCGFASLDSVVSNKQAIFTLTN